MPPEPTVYIVDDELIIRLILEDIFNAANLPVETYASAEDFLVTYSPDNPGCLLLDIIMPGIDGLELQKALTARGNKTPVIFLTGSGDVPIAVEAMKAGATDFIQKPVEADTVLKCVNKAMALDLRRRYERLQRSQVEQRITLLTPRELEVMNWVVRGKSNKMIARILDISSRTVEVHRKKVIDKMQAESVADLVQMALKTHE
jgi:FixJ family two-component response regulator